MTRPLAALCSLVVIAASLSLWWFVIAAGALLVGLHFEHGRRAAGARANHAAGQPLPFGTATIVSLASYALLLSIVLLTVRSAMGLLELPIVPFEPAEFAPGMRRATVGYYDKAELRLALLELVVLTVLFTVVFVRLASDWAHQQGKPFALHPMSAAFAFVLYFASVRLPPYSVDPEYWYRLVATATQIDAGEWRSLAADADQGPLRPYLRLLWLSAFGSSPLSLSAAATACTIAAGIAIFVLMRKLTGSRAVALLGASYLLLEATTTPGVRLGFPAPAHVAFAMLLLYLSLHSGGGRKWPAFLFGLVLPWDPLFGAFAAISFLLTHGGRIDRSPTLHRSAGVRTLLAMGGGILASVVAGLALDGVLASSSPQAPLAGEALKLRAAAAGLESPLPLLVLLVPVFLLLALASRRRGRPRQWSARALFAGSSLLCAVPYACLAAVRAEPSHAYAIHWVLLPAASVALYGCVRAISFASRPGVLRRVRAARAFGMSGLVLVVCFDIAFPVERLNRVIERYATAYEFERATWYRQCTTERVCDPGTKPSLAHHVRHASRPLTQEAEIRRGL